MSEKKPVVIRRSPVKKLALAMTRIPGHVFVRMLATAMGLKVKER